MAMEFSLLPEEIVEEILGKLPNKDLFQVKCVSKRYKSMITKFGQAYLQRAYSCPQSWARSGLSSALMFPYILDEKTVKAVKSYTVSSVLVPHYDGGHRVVDSSNALILSCGLSPIPRGRGPWRLGISVLNPLSKQCVEVPEPIRVQRPGDMVALAFAARHTSGAFLTYKVVSIHCPVPPIREGANTTVEIFSSDTGKWVAREVWLPSVLLIVGRWLEAVAYNGILHQLDSSRNSIVSYDPFDSPDRFGRMELPDKGTTGGHRSLIHCGGCEMPRYCELLEERLSVWRLEKGEWVVEAKFVVPQAYSRGLGGMVVTSHPLKLDMICIPYVNLGEFPVIDSRLGIYKFVNLGFQIDNNSRPRIYPLFPIHFCPWSSPPMVVL